MMLWDKMYPKKIHMHCCIMHTNIYSISTIASIIIVESKWNVQGAGPKCPATAWSFPATCTMGNSDRCKYDNHVELTNQHLLKGGI